MPIHPEDWILLPNQENAFNGSEPVPPYNIGDTWIDALGDLYRCISAKSASESFLSTDWELVNPGLGTVIKWDDPELGIVIYFNNDAPEPWNNGCNIQVQGDRINMRSGKDIVASWVGRDVNLGTWAGDTMPGDSATISFFDGSARFVLTIGATRDLLTIGAGDIDLRTGVDGLMWNGRNIGAAIFSEGDIFISTSSLSPAIRFGGSWERIENRFLYAVPGGTATGTTGGANTHTLTIAEMPRHDHVAPVNNAGAGAYSGAATTYTGNVSNANALNFSLTGSSAAHNNMPAYYTVYAWRKVA